MNEDAERIDTTAAHAERVRGLGQLPRSRSPESDLWPGIEARLGPRRSRYAWGQFALAASLVAGLAAVFTVGLRDARLTASGPEIATAPSALADDSRAIVEANLSIVEQAERELRQALQRKPDSTALRSLLQSAEHRQRALRAML